MHRDTIQRLTDNYLELGARRHTVRYNDHEFTLEVKARQMDRTTNDQARTRAALNMQANIRKSALGLGMGQYLSPDQLAALQKGHVELRANVCGKSYAVPLEVSADGNYSCPFLKSKTTSLRDIAAKVMDGLFQENGVDNMYRDTNRMRQVIAQDAISRPSGYGMRM
jgi:hypothetical protein